MWNIVAFILFWYVDVIFVDKRVKKQTRASVVVIPI